MKVGVLSRSLALFSGFTGVLVRGSGVIWDLRKVSRYELYPKVKFIVPTHLRGDSFSRYHIRVEEMRQSLKIMEWTLNKLEIGEFMNDL
jgi:NADH:ubiquinone oxidoreductase subunit D